MASIRSHPLFEVWYPHLLIIQESDSAAQGIVDIWLDVPKEGDVVGISIALTNANNIRLVSISHGDIVYSFDIKLIGAFPLSLKTFLEDDHIVKMGHGIVDIAWHLYREHEVKLLKGGEISRLHRILNTNRANIGEAFGDPVALSSIAEYWLNKTIVNDYIRCRWVDKFELVHYKHTSAIAAVVGQSYKNMREKHHVDGIDSMYWMFTSIVYATGSILGRSEDFPLYTLANTTCVDAIRVAVTQVRATLTESDLHLQRIGMPNNSRQEYPRITRLYEDVVRAILTYDQSTEEADIE